MEITWQIDWVPETTPARTDINPLRTVGLDVAGTPQLYPVFDAERGFDTDGDGMYTFPDDVPTDPDAPGFEERAQDQQRARWTVPAGGRTLVWAVGHLHPGGLYMDMQVARDGPDAGSTAGDDPSEVRPLFRSDARYYEPAGAVSWDVAMTATRPDWRVHLKAGDVVSVNATYDVRKASWYESMGLFPLEVSTVDDDPLAKDPFDDEAAVKAMYDAGGILTHGRLPENIDAQGEQEPEARGPAQAAQQGPPGARGRARRSTASATGSAATRRSGASRPPCSGPRWSSRAAASPSPTSTRCRRWRTPSRSGTASPPAGRRATAGSGIGYPLAQGPIKFDSGQLGYGTGLSSEVTTGSNVYTTPPLTKPGKTYTYFCRIHPFMRGSIRVAGGKPRRR